jgi:hypothetical protein
VLVGSDGVFDNLLPNEIADRIRRGPLAEAARRLASACLERMLVPSPGVPSKPDDLSFLLFRRRPRRRAP